MVNTRAAKRRAADLNGADPVTKPEGGRYADLSVKERVSATAEGNKRQKLVKIEEPETNLAARRVVVLRTPKRLRRLYMPFPKGVKLSNGSFAFGWNPLWHHFHGGPSGEQCQNVLDILVKYHQEHEAKPFDIPLTADVRPMGESALERPGHAPVGITIDNIVKVVFSQATKNENAISAHKILCSRFTYDVEGRSIPGDVPNYHKMRICPEAELREIIRPGGLYTVRAKGFLELLNMVYSENCKRLGLDESVGSTNAPGARDFVAGLLSLDYLNDMSKEELMNYLLGISNIGIKTAACILAFNFRKNVFAVDVHVLHMVRLLGWVPAEVKDRDKACMALDTIIPDHLKYGLHQAFWHHRVECVRCKFYEDNSERSKKWASATCPLDHLCNRSISSIDKSPKKEISTDATMDTTPGDDQTTVSPSTNTSKRRSVRVKTKPNYMPFSKMKAEKAYSQGYVLTRTDTDGDFGISGQQTFNTVMWILKERIHEDAIVTVQEALDTGLLIQTTTTTSTTITTRLQTRTSTTTTTPSNNPATSSSPRTPGSHNQTKQEDKKQTKLSDFFTKK